MIVNGVLQLFGTQIRAANTDVLGLQDSLEKTVTAAGDIDRAVSAASLDPGVSEVSAATSQLATALGSAHSLSDVQNGATGLSRAVNSNTGFLGEKVQDAITKTEDVVNKVETAINSWGNVHDGPSLDKAVKDTGEAAGALGSLLTFFGAIITIVAPPVGAALIIAGTTLQVVAGSAERVAGQVQPVVNPQTGSETEGQTDGETGSETDGETDGETEGQTQGETEGQTQGETEGQTQGETEGQTQGETEGQTQGETGGITEGQTDGETGGITEGPTDGETGGITEGPTDGETGGITEGETLGETGGITGGETLGETGGITGGETDGQTEIETGGEIGTDLSVGTDVSIGTDLSSGTGLNVVTGLDVDVPETRDSQTRQSLEKLMRSSLLAGDLGRASSHADEYAHRTAYELRHEHYVSTSKLRHDVQQLEYLRAQGVRLNNIEVMVDRYRQVIGDASRDQKPAERRWHITDAEYRKIGSFYNRIIYRPETGRVPHALASHWNRGQVETQFLKDSPGLATIDGFLSPDALQKLRKFCLESVIWFNNRYAYGRLGTVFARGFNCPLLVQLGQEIASAFPNIIGPDHRLRQVWAFKNSQEQPRLAPHADFAAVNVNIWLTPDSANMDPGTGGLDVYNIEAPQEWEFSRYNSDGRAINNYLRETRASVTRIPYRENRAIVFNSDLFHATQPLAFAPGYANRRINVTFLFGLREEDANATVPAGTSRNLRYAV